MEDKQVRLECLMQAMKVAQHLSDADDVVKMARMFYAFVSNAAGPVVTKPHSLGL